MLPKKINILRATRHELTKAQHAWLKEHYGNYEVRPFPASVVEAGQLYRQMNDRCCDEIILTAPVNIWAQVSKYGLKPLHSIKHFGQLGEGENYPFKTFERIERAVLKTAPLLGKLSGRVIWIGNTHQSHSQIKWIVKRHKDADVRMENFPDLPSYNGKTITEFVESQNVGTIIISPMLALWNIAKIFNNIPENVTLLKGVATTEISYHARKNNLFKNKREWEFELRGFEKVINAQWVRTKM